ncbi:MAG: hypothetical protein L6Q71_07720, partial [Planctomycetes bacterium]|nr:hypothetical protein [Planctomycetota bacterium]
MPDNTPAPRKPTGKLAPDARASARSSARTSTGAAPTPVKGTTQNIKAAGTKIPPPSAKAPDTSRKSQIAKNEAPARQSTSQSTTVRKASPADKTATGGVKPVNPATSARGKASATDTLAGGRKPVSGDPAANTKVRAVGDSTVSGRATSRNSATSSAQGSRRPSETLGGGRVPTSGTNKDARSTNSGKRPPTRKAGDANPGAAQKSAELAEAAAASRRKSKLIWAICIVITVVCVGGAVRLLMNAPDSVTGGGKKSSSAGMAFLNEVVRGHRLDSSSIEEFSDLKSAIAALSDDHRAILAKGAPHAPDSVTKPETLEAIANVGLASTLHKEHEAVKSLYDRWVEMQQCFSKKDDASCERAVVLLFQVKTEVTLLTEHLDELRANDDELSRKLHP